MCLLRQVSIHTPTQGVTLRSIFTCCQSTFQSTHPRRVWQVDMTQILLNQEFQSTHPRRVWPASWITSLFFFRFQSTHPRRVWHVPLMSCKVLHSVSIHTPTQGVTPFNPERVFSILFQSTHPRRVWPYQAVKLLWSLSFNPHTHAGCDHFSPMRLSL